jgi:hypothetical protein
VLLWLAAGVDAVALGSGLGDLDAAQEWRELLRQLGKEQGQPQPVIPAASRS